MSASAPMHTAVRAVMSHGAIAEPVLGSSPPGGTVGPITPWSTVVVGPVGSGATVVVEDGMVVVVGGVVVVVVVAVFTTVTSWAVVVVPSIVTTTALTRPSALLS